MAEYITSLEVGKDYLLFRTGGEYSTGSVRDHGKIYRNKLSGVRLLGRYYVTADCGGFYSCVQREKENGKRMSLSVQKNDLVSKGIIAVPCGDDAVFPIPEKEPGGEG